MYSLLYMGYINNNLCSHSIQKKNGIDLFIVAVLIYTD